MKAFGKSPVLSNSYVDSLQVAQSIEPEAIPDNQNLEHMPPRAILNTIT